MSRHWRPAASSTILAAVRPTACVSALLLLTWSAVAVAEEPSAESSDPGNLGLGWLGLRVVPSAVANGQTIDITAGGDAVLTIAEDDIVVPLFGGRYWFGQTVGLQLGVGFNVAGGTASRTIPNPDPAESKTTSFPAVSTAAFAAQLGLPIAAVRGKHFAGLVIPEVALGLSSATVADFEVSVSGDPLDLRLSALQFAAGARVGGEVRFGFWGVPELALQGAWGLHFEHNRRTGRIGDAEMTVARNGFGTAWASDPAASIVGGLGLLYYF